MTAKEVAELEVRNTGDYEGTLTLLYAVEEPRKALISSDYNSINVVVPADIYAMSPDRKWYAHETPLEAMKSFCLDMVKNSYAARKILWNIDDSGGVVTDYTEDDVIGLAREYRRFSPQSTVYIETPAHNALNLLQKGIPFRSILPMGNGDIIVGFNMD